MAAAAAAAAAKWPSAAEKRRINVFGSLVENHSTRQIWLEEEEEEGEEKYSVMWVLALHNMQQQQPRS